MEERILAYVRGEDSEWRKRTSRRSIGGNKQILLSHMQQKETQRTLT